MCRRSSSASGCTSARWAARCTAWTAAPARTFWVYPAGGAITHTACVAGGKVFFASADGCLYALSADKGELAWKFATPCALWNSPVVHDGRCIFGGRDGKLYAVNVADSKSAWTYTATAALLDSPAIDAARHAVYISDENCVVHAVDAATGVGIWRSAKLSGVTCRSYHPVIAPDGTVLTRTLPFYSWDRARKPYDDACRALFGTQDVTAENSKYPGVYTAMPDWKFSKSLNDDLRRHVLEVIAQPDYVQRFTDELLKGIAADPATQTLWMLDPASGKQTVPAAVLYTSSGKSEFFPPVVTPGRQVVTKWLCLLRSRIDGYQNFLNLGHAGHPHRPGGAGVRRVDQQQRRLRPDRR